MKIKNIKKFTFFIGSLFFFLTNTMEYTIIKLRNGYFQCAVEPHTCSQTYTRLYNCSRHIKTHHLKHLKSKIEKKRVEFAASSEDQEKRFVSCKICNEKFTKRAAMFKHFFVNHCYEAREYEENAKIYFSQKAHSNNN